MELQKAVNANSSLIVENIREAKDFIQKCFAKHEADRQEKLWKVIKMLKFPDMQTRHESIMEAFPSTFSWALRKDIRGLQSWLRAGSNTYWIAGKAGSGKSTFMKFLSNDPRTIAHLSHWSGGPENLILVQCYFWFSGSSMQKSIEGLLRTIVYQILCACPHVVEILLPDRWKLSKKGPGFVQPFWSVEELEALLRKAPHAIAHVNDVLTGLQPPKFCLFVDGLDEYSGNHGQLVQVLHDLTSTGNMKVVVSSRPWNIFVRAYETRAPHLFLQDLTAGDIRLYVESNIMRSLVGPAAYIPTSPSERDVRSIISDIINRAEGVFLWVHLVVQSVIRGFDEGDSIDTLSERVLAFPTDLEEFFDNILGRVESFYHHHTTQALYLAYLYAENHDEAASCSSYLDFELLSRNRTGLEDPQYLWNLQPQALSAQDFVSLIKHTRTFLSACCKDLLVVDIPHDQRDIWSCAGDPSLVRVRFFHRTVFEYLRSSKHRQWLEQGTPQCFNDGSVFHLLNMAKLKLYWSERSRSSVPEYYNRQCLFSLSHAWKGLDLAFINELDACRAFYQEACCATVGAAYIAFEQLGTFKAKYTVAQIRESGDDEDIAGHELKRMYHNPQMSGVGELDIYLRLLAATLGVAECRGFPYQSVNFGLLLTIMSSSTGIVFDSPLFRRAEAEILLKFLRKSLPSLVEMSVAPSKDTLVLAESTQTTLPHMQAIIQLLMHYGFAGMRQVFEGVCPIEGDAHYKSLWERLTTI